VIFAANALRGRKFPGGAPRKKPIFHTLVAHIMPGLYLSHGLPDFRLLAIFHRGFCFRIVDDVLGHDCNYTRITGDQAVTVAVECEA
jgi:hypothetical protein